jgi:hypothetical protein
MFSRLSQLARHFSHPLPNFAHRPAAAFPFTSFAKMTSSSTAQSIPQKSPIHTAGCIIIGDEVLGGKVALLDLIQLPMRAGL